jgi:ElaB/YqjD/DUF883 family membrane-anchored ribosome-binding protein
VIHEHTAHDGEVGDEAPPEVEEIRADIESTRNEMSGTLNELGERLDPGNLMHQAKHNVREATIGRVEETAKGVSDMVMDTIKRNPVPAALAGAGLALLWANRSPGQQDVRSQGRPAAGIGTVVGDTASSIGESVGGAVGSVADGAQQIGGEVICRAGDTAQQVTWKLDRFMKSSPLAMGAIAAGVGAVLGSLLPETDKEREVLGDASRQVTTAVRDTVDEATSRAETTLDRTEARLTSPA